MPSNVNFDALVNKLWKIGFTRAKMRLIDRGWSGALGLHVDLKFGTPSRLTAGGSMKDYIDITVGDGNYTIRRFDAKTWDRRFAELVEPALDLTGFIYDRVGSGGYLGQTDLQVVQTAISTFKSSGVWTLDREDAERQRALLRHQAIAQTETALQEEEASPRAGDYFNLGILYHQDGRVMDAERALKQAVEHDPSGSYHEQLAYAYFAAYSHSVLDRPLSGNGSTMWSGFTPGALGYGLEELRRSAKDQLERWLSGPSKPRSRRQQEEARRLLRVLSAPPAKETLESYEHGG